MVAQGLCQRLSGHPPEAMAAVTLWVNSAGMRRRITAALVQAGVVLMPRIRLVTELAGIFPLSGAGPAVPALRRRLELAQLVSHLIEREPTLAPRAAAFDLAESLSQLFEEMAGEGVAPQVLAGLDVSQHSEHWARAQRFLGIATEYCGHDMTRLAEGQRRQIALDLARRWASDPPAGSQIVVGSTGSRGATALFMEAVAALAQGMIILPGFDFEMPDRAWRSLDDALTAEDHPQYRYRLLLDRLDLRPEDVRPWVTDPAPAPERNRMVSLSLRPAPVTDQWIAEGPGLADLRETCAPITLIEAQSPRAEAQAIALVMRAGLEGGRRVGLITPDRALARQVTAALDRWGILPDDSAGRPLQLSPQGRLLRQIAELAGSRLAADRLLAVLKHPNVHDGAGRGQHLRLVREFELRLRRSGPIYPARADVLGFAAERDDARQWASWLGACLDRVDRLPVIAPLSEHLHAMQGLVEALALGGEPGAQLRLWSDDAGRAVRGVIDALTQEAGAAGTMTSLEFAELLSAVLGGEQLRDNALSTPSLTIWGTREAREHMPEIMVLGGLNEGSWPQMPPPDPWLNRQMRLQAGLLLPERRVGLMAHDYQQAIAAPEVVLSRAIRNEEAQTTPSRWLNRLLNLIGGLGVRHGPEALEAMRARGQDWLELARRLDQPLHLLEPAPRPAPAPPLKARPRVLPVTAIERLIRDPYAIYARYVLRLYPLSPLRQTPDARLRGSVFHAVLEGYALEGPYPDRASAKKALGRSLTAELQDQIPWPAARLLFEQRVLRVADWFLDLEGERAGRPVVLESPGAARLTALDVVLTARPDRIDVLPDGRVQLFDYKTGDPPTTAVQHHFNKQLPLTAAIVQAGGFREIALPEIAGATYVGLGANPKVAEADVSPEAIARTVAELEELLAAYADPGRGYPARRAQAKVRYAGDYDHLARHGEWDDSAAPVVMPVGGYEDHG